MKSYKVFFIVTNIIGNGSGEDGIFLNTIEAAQLIDELNRKFGISLIVGQGEFDQRNTLKFCRDQKTINRPECNYNCKIDKWIITRKTRLKLIFGVLIGKVNNEFKINK